MSRTTNYQLAKLMGYVPDIKGSNISYKSPGSTAAFWRSQINIYSSKKNIRAELLRVGAQPLHPSARRGTLQQWRDHLNRYRSTPAQPPRLLIRPVLAQPPQRLPFIIDAPRMPFIIEEGEEEADPFIIDMDRMPPRDQQEINRSFRRLEVSRGQNVKQVAYISNYEGIMDLKSFFEAIKSKIETRNLATLRFKFLGPEGTDPQILSVPKSIVKDYETFQEFASGVDSIPDIMNVSDAYREYSTISLYWFGLVYLVANGGAEPPYIRHNNKKTKNIAINGLLCQSFPSKDDNCFLEVMRNATNKKDLRSNQIRKLLNIPKGPIDATDKNLIDRIEDYFGIKTAIVTSAQQVAEIVKKGSETDLRERNIREFRTKVTTNFATISGNIETADVWIMLKDNHYTLVQRLINQRFCYISGQPLNRKDKATRPIYWIRRFFIETGVLIVPESLKKKKKDKKEKEKKVKPKRYWFFDYETVYDIFGCLEPYSAACVVGTIDKESGKFIEDTRFCEVSKNCNLNLLLWMTQNKSDKEKNILVGYNSSRFDNFLLTRELLKHGLLGENSVFFAGNSILKLVFGSFTTIDLCRFTMMPLATACKEFGCNIVKGSLSHAEVQDYYFMKGDKFFDDLHKKGIKTIVDGEEKLIKAKDIIDYNILDCTSLADLYCKVKTGFEKLSGKDIDDFMTISQLAYDKWDDSDHGVEAPESLKVWQFMRKAAFGGRSQIFTPGHFKGTFQAWDVKSLYPFVMLNCYFPIGKEIETKKYMKGKLGIYSCRVISQPKDKIIPKRSAKNPLDWEHDKPFECNLTSVDIECIREFGGKVEIIPNEEGVIGYYWENKSKTVFADYLIPFKNEKSRQDSIKDTPEYNAALRAICKLAMNSLSGKVIQKMYKSSTKLCTNLDQIAKFMKKHDDVVINPLKGVSDIYIKGNRKEINYSQKRAKPNFLGVFIYSHARTHMYQSVISKFKEKFAMDTDSIHVRTKSKVEKAKKDFVQEIDFKTMIPQEKGYGKFNIGNEFGDFEAEIPFDTRDVYFVSSKCYGLFGNKDGESERTSQAKNCTNCKENNTKSCTKCEKNCKMRFKGISSRDRIIDMPLEDFEKLSIKEKFKLYESLPPALSEKLYKTLTDKKPVTVLCSQIRRVAVINNGDSCVFTTLQQVFMFKTIKPNGKLLLN